MNENNAQINEEILYREWVPAGKVIKIIMLSVFLLNSIIGIIIVAFIPRNLIFIGWIFGAVSLLLLLLYWNFRGIRIALTRHYLDVGYGILNHKKIFLEKITGCEITKAYFRRYGGLGVRFGLDGSWAYTTNFGQAVKLFFQKGRPFVFSTRNPQKICHLINEITRI